MATEQLTATMVHGRYYDGDPDLVFNRDIGAVTLTVTPAQEAAFRKHNVFDEVDVGHGHTHIRPRFTFSNDPPSPAVKPRRRVTAADEGAAS